MAYYNGTAATFADLKTAIEAAAVANGYTLTSDVLNKGGCFFKLVAVQVPWPSLKLTSGTGQSGSALTGASPTAATIAGFQVNPMSFPISYEIHVFANPDELYCFINYNSDFYQQISFGKSNVPGIGGTGAWLSGCYNGNISQASQNGAVCYFSASSGDWGPGASNSNNILAGLFTEQAVNVGVGPSQIHCGLDSVAWRNTGITSNLTGLTGREYCASLIGALPNVFNQSTVLLPIKAIARRASGLKTIVANLKNSRYCRIDNLNPGAIVVYGSDQWKIYPMYRKNITERNGLSTGAQHSGTFGFAIKYTG
ncbi:hypothetical protein [Pseudomonas phage KP1]|uniref:Virion structural protein n=1 Tax=Pseudomonas phage KP1 TaxID=2562463 RepID=A0A6G5QAV7_9CAUD|nr:structural protein [Pseudomonas phage KP1]QBZ71730.1 hypothetical protein [Pseudomonas phage KP1]